MNEHLIKTCLLQLVAGLSPKDVWVGLMVEADGLMVVSEKWISYAVRDDLTSRAKSAGIRIARWAVNGLPTKPTTKALKQARVLAGVV